MPAIRGFTVFIGVVATLLVTLLAALGDAPAQGAAVHLVPPLPTGERSALAASAALAGSAAGPAAKACSGLPSFDQATADEIMAGKLTLSPFPAVTVDPHRDGGINWSQDPFHHPTWQQNFQSGGWIEMLISGYLAGAAHSAAYLERAEALTKGWLAGAPLSARDPETVICISEGFPGQSWIDDQIAASVNYLAAHWQGPWNHGLAQDLKLMRIGCAYPATAFGGQALTWRKTAYSQILSAFRPSRLGPSIDAQGAVNEQATGYERYVYHLWQAGLPELTACGYHLPPAITARIAKMTTFLAEATQPDGNLVQIGDTYVEGGTALPRPPSLVAVYPAGYVFGRSKFAPNGTFYSIRFGPARQVHGHSDHMGLTYFSRGRNLIVDAGHTGYEVSAYRDYLKSPEAASMLVVPGDKFRAAAPTTLVADKISSREQFFEFSDDAFAGTQRSRGVYVHDGPDFALVLDRASGARDYQQLWHLDPSLTVRSVTAREAIAAAPAAGQAPATSLVLLRIPLPGYAIPARSTTVVKGTVSPYQGWVSQQALQRTPAPVVIMSSNGTGAAGAAQMLTLIAATAPGTPVGARIVSRATNGAYRVSVRIGTSTVTVEVQPNGAINDLLLIPAGFEFGTSWANTFHLACRESRDEATLLVGRLLWELVYYSWHFFTGALMLC